jgi:acetylglutamate kinase
VSSPTGSVSDLSMKPVEWSLASGHVPVLQSIGETVATEDGGAGGRIVVLDIEEVTACLAVTLKPRKVLFINTHGGFTDGRGEVREGIYN